MIDWVTATLPLSSDFRFTGGRVMSCDMDGAIEWQTEKRLPIVGSFDSKFHFVSKGAGFIHISRNTTKQGRKRFRQEPSSPFLMWRRWP